MGGGGEQAAAARGAAVVDFVYGLPPDSSTGGCVVQRSFEQDLRAAPGVVSVNVHVASDPASARRVFRLLQQQDDKEEGACGVGGEPRSRVLIIDGIALLFLRERLHELRSPRSAKGGGGGGGARRARRVLAGFVHCPFSEPFYREEPWLRAALPEHMLLDKDGGSIRAEETRLFGLFDKIIAVGAPCRGLLTADYGVQEDAIVVLEPAFQTSMPAAAAAAAAAATAGLAGTVEDALPAAGAAEVSGELLPPRFVSVGTLCPRKGQLALIAALRAACAAHPAELGGSVLTLVGGDGGDLAYAGDVRAAAAVAAVGDDVRKSDDNDDGGRGRGAGLRVRVLGSLSHTETLETVAAGDAFLLNSCLESWAMAPVEAALRGVPVISTQVGLLRQTLPAESTIWVGSSGHAEQGHGKGGAAAAAAAAAGDSLASATDWEKALLRFAHDRRRLQVGAQRAVPDLARRYGQTTVAGSRAMAVQKLLRTTAAGSARSRGWSGSVGLPNVSASLAAVDAADEECVRSATVTNALACVCATCVSISGEGGAGAGLAALVAAQLLMLVNLAPPWSPANLVTIFRSFIPPAVVWWKAGSDFGEVAMADVAAFGLLFVALDVVDGMLARRSKTGPTRVGAALDVESDSVAVLFLSLAASRKAWFGGFIAGVLRYLFVLATGARELPPSPIGPAGRWFAKWAALASVAALAASVGNGTVAGTAAAAAGGRTEEGSDWARGHGSGGGGAEGSSPFLCAAGVAVLCASFSVDFFQIWVLLPREAATKAAAVAMAAASKRKFGNGSGVEGEADGVVSPAVAVVRRGGEGKVGGGGSKSVCCKSAREVPVKVSPFHG